MWKNLSLKQSLNVFNTNNQSKSTSYTADNNCVIYKYSQQVVVFSRHVKHINMSYKSHSINILQLSFIALSLAFSLVSISYKLSVKLCFRCAFQVKKNAFKISSRRHPDVSTWRYHSIGKQFQIDQWLKVIRLLWQFRLGENFIECRERLNSRS